MRDSVGVYFDAVDGKGDWCLDREMCVGSVALREHAHERKAHPA